MKVKAIAPTRIDLSGGTLDIYPLYLFEGYGLTINAAVNRFANVEIVPREDKRITIFSKNMNRKISFKNLSELKDDEKFGLLIKFIKFFKPEKGFDMITDVKVPVGSGLGGSSALSVAVCGALNKFTGRKYSSDDILKISQDIETQHLGIPTGRQDYYASLFGGFNSIRFKVHEDEIEKLKISKSFLKTLYDRTILCYTGVSRNSGINNWDVFKRYVDGDQKVIKSIRNIRGISLEMKKSLVLGDIEKFSMVLQKEWKNRKRLSPSITTPTIELMMKNARKVGAMSNKVCGAGGGGCMIVLTKENSKEDVEKSLVKDGAKILDFRFSENGLRVEAIE